MWAVGRRVRTVQITDRWHLLRNLTAALAKGNSGLPGGSSLTKLLAQHRSVRNVSELPPLRTTFGLE
jgi:hypothetical protein